MMIPRSSASNSAPISSYISLYFNAKERELALDSMPELVQITRAFVSLL